MLTFLICGLPQKKVMTKFVNYCLGQILSHSKIHHKDLRKEDNLLDQTHKNREQKCKQKRLLEKWRKKQKDKLERWMRKKNVSVLQEISG